MLEDRERPGGGLVDPYTGEDIPRGSRVRCRTGRTGVTLCKVEDRRGYLGSILVIAAAFAVLLLLFSVRIEVRVGSAGASLGAGAALLSLAAALPVISVLAGAGLGIVYVSRRK